MSSAVAPEGWDVDEMPSVLNVESATETRPHTLGARPSVAYTLVGHASNHILYRVPVEVKKKIITGHMAQHAGQSRTGVGYLTDESSF